MRRWTAAGGTSSGPVGARQQEAEVRGVGLSAAPHSEVTTRERGRSHLSGSHREMPWPSAWQSLALMLRNAAEHSRDPTTLKGVRDHRGLGE